MQRSTHEDYAGFFLWDFDWMKSLTSQAWGSLREGDYRLENKHTWWELTFFYCYSGCRTRTPGSSIPLFLPKLLFRGTHLRYVYSERNLFFSRFLLYTRSRYLAGNLPNVLTFKTSSCRGSGSEPLTRAATRGLRVFGSCNTSKMSSHPISSTLRVAPFLSYSLASGRSLSRVGW